MTYPRTQSKCPFCGHAVCYDEGSCGCVGEENYYQDREEEEDEETDN